MHTPLAAHCRIQWCSVPTVLQVSSKVVSSTHLPPSETDSCFCCPHSESDWGPRELMKVSSCVGAQWGLQPHRALERILTIWHVLLAPGKLNCLPVSNLPRFFPSPGICSCCPLPLKAIQLPSSPCCLARSSQEVIKAPLRFQSLLSLSCLGLFGALYVSNLSLQKLSENRVPKSSQRTEQLYLLPPKNSK